MALHNIAPPDSSRARVAHSRDIGQACTHIINSREVKLVVDIVEVQLQFEVLIDFVRGHRIEYDVAGMTAMRGLTKVSVRANAISLNTSLKFVLNLSQRRPKSTSHCDPNGMGIRIILVNSTSRPKGFIEMIHRR